MKQYARTVFSQDREQIVIHLPDPMLLQIIARSVFLALLMLCFPSILRTLAHHTNAIPEPEPKWIDDPFMLPMLVRDLKRYGLFNSDTNAVFLGDPRSRLSYLKRNGIEPVSEKRKLSVEDYSVDFVLATDGFGDEDIKFVDRVLKVGGIVTVRLSDRFYLPSNYRLAYIRRFGSTIVAIKKNSRANNADDDCGGNVKDSG